MNPLTQKSDFLYIGHVYEVINGYYPLTFPKNKVVISSFNKKFVWLKEEGGEKILVMDLKRKFVTNLVKDITTGRSFVS